jgi:hypothetical protein
MLLSMVIGLRDDARGDGDDARLMLEVAAEHTILVSASFSFLCGWMEVCVLTTQQ